MTGEPAGILSHVPVGTDDLARAAASHNAVLPLLGCRRMLAHPGAVGDGRVFPEFRVHIPEDGTIARPDNGTHVAFPAAGWPTVDAVHAAALAAGVTEAGAPGPRPHYGAPYDGGFVRDPDGNKIEAMFRAGPPP